MKQHFTNIFAKMEAEKVRASMLRVWKQLEKECKQTGGRKWMLAGLRGRIPRVRRLVPCAYRNDGRTGCDNLYKGRMPQGAKQSVTVLLPKERRPRDWSSARAGVY